MPGRSLWHNEGLSEADEKSVEAARKAGCELGAQVMVDRLAAEESEMQVLDLGVLGLGDEWAVEFARRALPNMPKLERLM